MQKWHPAFSCFYRLCALSVLVVILTACSHNGTKLVAFINHPAPAYDYPLENPYAATIIGTPSFQKLPLSKTIEPTKRKILVFPERTAPEGFWYTKRFEYGEFLQKDPAPLVFIIGGTGSGYLSSYTVALAKALYESGNHVVMLPSPTHSNFIINASTSFLPGYAETDAEDLYHVMHMIQQRVQEKRTITETRLTGFSLGAWHAAFVKKRDEQEQEQKLNITRTVLLNPPLSIYHSIERIDTMLMADLPKGMESLGSFLDETVASIGQLQQHSDAFDFSNENLLYEGYLAMQPDDKKLQTAIGLAFRLAAANMIFTADVMGHYNYLYPLDKPFTSTTPLSPYMAMAIRTSFMDYFRDVYVPHHSAQESEATEEALIARASLKSIGPWLRKNPDVYLITNRDDIILDAEDLRTLQALFPNKAYILPTGGHLGNLEHPHVMWHVLRALNGEHN